MSDHVREAPDCWLDTPDAAEMMCCTPESLKRAAIGSAIRREIRGGNTTPRGAGWLWYRPDIELAARLRREGLTVNAAIRSLGVLRNMSESVPRDSLDSG